MTRETCLLAVRPESSLLFGDESGTGNYEKTADYIPGAVLRGAIGKKLLEASCTQPDHKHDHAGCPDRETCAFWHVFFGENPPIFGNAYVAPRGWGFPFPVTARTCKLYPGYRTEDNPEGHGVFDRLIPQFVYDLVSDPRFPHREDLLRELGQQWAQLPPYSEPKCMDPGCEASVVAAEGYYLSDDGTPVYVSQPTVSRATHVGINRSRGVAEEDLLFTLETIEAEGQIEFRARLTYDGTYADDLSTVLDLDGEIVPFSIGRGRSRGLGEVTLTVDPAPYFPDLEDRLDDFNAEVRDAVAPYHEADQRVAEQFPVRFFSLTLRAPAILATESGLPALWPDLSPFKLAAAKPVRAWARTTTIGGWDAAAGLPRTNHQAVEAGSVFLFYLSEGIIEDEAAGESLRGRLERLEQVGLGAERERGYGQVTVCAPFHYAGWRR